MAKKKAKKTVGKQNKKRNKFTGSQIVLLISIIAAALAFYPTTMILLVGMAPTIVAHFSDDSKNGLAAITVGGLNFCGVMVPLMALWIGDNSFDYSLVLLLDPLNWLIMYSTAALGWGVWYGIPSLYAGLSVSTAERRLKSLRETRAELIQEWGAELNRIEVERREAREALEEARKDREEAANAASKRASSRSAMAA